MKNTHTFIEQAEKGDNRWWKYLLSILTILISFVLGQLPITFFLYYKKEALKINDQEFIEYIESANLTAMDISETTFFLLLLITFTFVFVAMIWLIPIIHKRTSLSFITRRSTFDFKRFFFGLSIWFVLAFVFIFLLLSSDQYTYNFDVNSFVPLAIIAILLVPIQVSVEEIVYRGFLMQGIYRITRNKWLTLIIITLLFALSHILNPEFQSGFLTIIPAYLIFSFTMGYITLLDHGLEIPIGIHAGNNLFVALILSASGTSVLTPSLFKTDIESLIEILPFLFILISLLSFTVLKLIYKWKFKFE